METCPNCYATIRPGSKFCYQCGYQLSIQQPQSYNTQKTNNMETNIIHQIEPRNIIDRAKNIMFQPKKEWDVISQEEPSLNKVVLTYYIPLLLIPTIAQIIGWGLIGKKVSIMMYSYTIKDWNIGITSGIASFITSILALFVLAFLIDVLAPSFKSEKNFNRSLQLAAYSYTPSLVFGIFHIIPALSVIVTLAGIYGLVLLYLGLKPVKRTPSESVVGYFIVIILAAILTFLLIGFIIGLITAPVIKGSMGLGY